MKIAFGILHIEPKVFWAMSVTEWVCALYGYMEANGLEAEEQPMTLEDLTELERQVGYYP